MVELNLETHAAISLRRSSVHLPESWWNLRMTMAEVKKRLMLVDLIGNLCDCIFWNSAKLRQIKPEVMPSVIISQILHTVWYISGERLKVEVDHSWYLSMFNVMSHPFLQIAMCDEYRQKIRQWKKITFLSVVCS